MSTSRLFSLFVALALVVVVVVTINAGDATSKVVSSTPAKLDQHERHPDLIAPVNATASDWFERHPDLIGSTNATASDWFERHVDLAKAGAALDQHDRHPSLQLPDNRTCVLCGGQ